MTDRLIYVEAVARLLKLVSDAKLSLTESFVIAALDGPDRVEVRVALELASDQLEQSSQTIRDLLETHREVRG